MGAVGFGGWVCVCSRHFLPLLAPRKCLPRAFRQQFGETLSKMRKATPKRCNTLYLRDREREGEGRERD